MIHNKIIEAVKVSVPEELADKIYWDGGCLCVPSGVSADFVFEVLEKQKDIYMMPTVLEYDEY